MDHKTQKLASNYHFVGIGGIGMSGLARLLLQQNIPVSGTDISVSPLIEELKTLGAEIHIGHDSKHVPETSSLVVSSDISAQNPELQLAHNQKLPILHRSDLLKLLLQGKKTLLVAGTHGKTTTTSLLTTVFLHAQLDPTYAIGGVLNETKKNASSGTSPYFVAEADESDGTFLKYHPMGAIITNIDNDHMNFYKDDEKLDQAFAQFASQVSELLFYCGDDTRLQNLKLKGISYGFHADCNLIISQYQQHGRGISFDIEFEGKKYSQVEARVLGKHNAYNAAAVFGLCLKLGISETAIREGLRAFQGVKRRTELIGEIHQIRILDDYGHHPTEIATTLSGIKAAFPLRRVLALFQPHRYTRTRDCLTQFGSCFDSVDELIITDLYSASETPIPGISEQAVLQQIQMQSNVKVSYVPKSALVDTVQKMIRPFDIIVTIGAGDITKEGPKIYKGLELKKPAKIKCGVLFGGKSPEHEISLLSAKNIIHGLDKEIYEISYFYINRQGNWIIGDDAKKALEKPLDQHHKISAEAINALLQCEVVFPVLHGQNGEDGTIQGMFEILNIPYAGCDHQSSAIAMDKAVTKKLAESKGLKVAPYIDFSKYEWLKEKEKLLQAIAKEFPFPLFVKPVHLGSTIGVRRVQSKDELIAAIDEGFKFDRHVLVEKAIIGREIEFAVFGSDEITVFPPGEVKSAGQVYDYNTKYFADDITTPKAELDQKTIQQGMEFAKRAYLSIGCNGYARVDCFLDHEGNFILNEINPIPGFTGTSLYPKMCENGGLGLSELLNTLIALGKKRNRENVCLKQKG